MLCEMHTFLMKPRVVLYIVCNAMAQRITYACILVKLRFRLILGFYALFKRRTYDIDDKIISTLYIVNDFIKQMGHFVLVLMGTPSLLTDLCISQKIIKTKCTVYTVH